MLDVLNYGTLAALVSIGGLGSLAASAALAAPVARLASVSPAASPLTCNEFIHSAQFLVSQQS